MTIVKVFRWSKFCNVFDRAEAHNSRRAGGDALLLTEKEIERVSGSLGPVNRQKKQVTKFKFEGTNFDFGLTHAHELGFWAA